MSLATCLAQVAPLYNLGLVLLVVVLFLKLFNTQIRDRRVDLMPWKLLFFAVIVFIIEEALTVLRQIDVINIPVHINGLFEFVIICVFIYTLLLQKQHIKTGH